MVVDQKKREVILTGMRPTGFLHLGHYVGALENWLKLQDKYKSYFLIADYQALGDHIDQTESIRQSVVEMVIDWLAVGLDPDKSTFVIQSYIPEFSELFMLLSMIIPIAYVERNPTLKAEMAQLKKKNISLGFFNYPASQVADILLFKANLVPVGEDQLPHIELTSDIAKKFNRLYGDVFPLPKPLVGRVARLVGTDGNAKMSKSLGNCIYLSDSEEVLKKKVMKMYTDPTRLRATDPGHVENNPVFIYLDAFCQEKNKEELEDLKKKYKVGGIGDVAVKEFLFKELNHFLVPIRERREHFKKDKKYIRSVIEAGTSKAKKAAEETLIAVRDAMKITGYEK